MQRGRRRGKLGEMQAKGRKENGKKEGKLRKIKLKIILTGKGKKEQECFC